MHLYYIELHIRYYNFFYSAGIIFSYVISQVALWWLFHVSYLFWKVIFLFHARLYGKVKCIHIMCSFVGIVLPLVSIITSMADFAVVLQKQSVNSTSQNRKLLFLSGGLGHRSNRYPPILFTGIDSDAQFYTFIIPIIIILASGCDMLLVILWSVHKIYKRKRAQVVNYKHKYKCYRATNDLSPL